MTFGAWSSGWLSGRRWLPISTNVAGSCCCNRNVTCGAFAGTYGKCAFIDGNLVACDLILNSFEDSALVIAGNLRTRFYYGQDIWAEVGGSAEMEFGDGYCLPIGYTEAAAEVIEQEHVVRARILREIG